MTASRCTATNRAGRQCGRPPIPGGTVCHLHGGAAPQVAAAAQRRLAEAQARDLAKRLALPLHTSPQQALLDEVQRAAGMVAYYGARVAELGEQDPNKLVHGVTRIEQREGFQAGTVRVAEPAVNMWLHLWNEERDRLTRAAAAAVRAGVEERRVLLAEQQGHLIADVIRRILGRLDLNDHQRTLIGTVVPDELRAISGALAR